MPLAKSTPFPMEDCSRSVLEWDKFLALLSGYSVSTIGKQWILNLRPSTDRAWLDRQHSLVDEMRLLLNEGAQPGLGSLFDPISLLDKSRIEGAALEAEEIRDLMNLADDISGWTSLLRVPPERVQDRIPELNALSAALFTTDLRPLVESLRTKILPDGTLTDDASPELRRIRREMERQQRAIEDSLRSALRRLSEGGSTQDDLITIRGERFVIPVKSELKRRVQGVIHGASSSGQTVYLEPLETIELNNELVRLLEDEQAEIHRIFLAMTRQIAGYGSIIGEGAAVLAEVESLLVRARFALEFQSVRPRFSDAVSADFELKQARHPLLEKRLRNSGGTIVPLTLGLSSDERQLIISGPNTGGKTVSLKTAGLLSIMAQAGVPVPAEEAVFPVFENILADIGDSQSIERNLSTFSAHIVNLNRIAQIANSGSLVLLDELGSATDPEEGAALAVAIAEHFLRSQAWSIISTHLTSLKVYAANHAGVRNAAVGFDEHTLSPTYALRLGVPGASAGINIAQRLGLDPEIVTAARSQLNTQTRDIASFLDRLHAQLEELGEERRRVQLLEQEVARERNRLATEGMKEWRAKVRELEQKLHSLLKDFEYQARETVRAIDDRAAQQKLSKHAEQRIARLRREFQESFNSAVVADKTGADKGDQHAHPHVIRNISVGDTVKLRTLGRTGVVQREIDTNIFEIAIGPMKMRVARDEIAEVIPVRSSPIDAARRRGVSVSVAEPDPELRAEINLIGKTVDEATDEVEKFLDRAYLAGLPRIRIVHGTGMGILRRALRSMLERHPHVASISEPSQAEGGAGATVVELRA
ncbi:endonuclease MutS2 [Alloacidobacterium dinghuense]|uniref:Endonuclease MutS2 n=1 Tax=Alloacidobacterium dinghuense TaxID=2763107 RepID=A0A7G8BGD2_9BACT|nr:endonuclease MutS2 [Alloacidobacterium dinghuense]QNI31602.1 endonuclease MutS2 [Alloacidobacterium dinghuense]